MSEIIFPIDCVFEQCDFPNCTCGITDHLKRVMTGKLNIVDANWVVEYPKHPTSSKIYETATLPLHPDDASICIRYSDYSTDWIGKNVEFEIVDEFTHPELFRGIGWGDGAQFAKLHERK